ncbi:MAG: hypothetical protein HZB36_06360 [Candidatus Omnitrophica bacterium]|nr:hypothetical protein [Candidatus Omnitrophota bacterium]
MGKIKENRDRHFSSVLQKGKATGTLSGRQSERHIIMDAMDAIKCIFMLK